jgi:hypothetical protein
VLLVKPFARAGSALILKFFSASLCVLCDSAVNIAANAFTAEPQSRANKFRTGSGSDLL